jgi:hypothetical protein
MSYLTYLEFKELTPTDITETCFSLLLGRSSDILDDVTNQFYVRNNMEDDNPWRVNQFKKALTSQIVYFHEVGATTFEGINREPYSFSAGRTKVSRGGGYSGKIEKSLVAKDVYVYLRGTGLLYSGVDVI